jgi:hypothetical protein
MANIATTPEDPQHFHVFKTEKREKKLQNQSRFELWRGTVRIPHPRHWQTLAKVAGIALATFTERV